MPSRQHGAELLPVDSEHNGAHQCLRAGHRGEASKLILTASGGPFRTTPREALEWVTPADALKHPTWKMGNRITIDSATLMNKGFEVIEAHWLFGFAPEEIEVVVHPQSTVHAMVEYEDGVGHRASLRHRHAHADPVRAHMAGPLHRAGSPDRLVADPQMGLPRARL